MYSTVEDCLQIAFYSVIAVQLNNLVLSDCQIVAIAKRDEDGVWRKLESAKLQEHDSVVYFQTERGIVVVIGYLEQDDHSAVLQLLDGANT